MKIHLLAGFKQRYLEYAVLSIHSLIENGGVDPKDIILTVDHYTENSLVFRRLTKKYPISSLVFDPTKIPQQKFFHVSRAFREFDTEAILQLDTDCYLSRKMNFIEFLKGINTDADILGYEQITNQKNLITSRDALSLPEFRFAQHDTNRFRFDALLRGWFHGSYEDYYSWVTKDSWVYGGFLIVNRKFWDRPEWDTFRAIGAISDSDETAVKIAHWAATKHKFNFSFGKLKSPGFEFLSSPIPLNWEDPRGMVHLSGKWYRHDNLEHLAMINAKIDELI